MNEWNNEWAAAFSEAEIVAAEAAEEARGDDAADWAGVVGDDFITFE